MNNLKPTLGAARGTAMMLNIVLGAGLLTLPGLAVKLAGEGALLVWVACALAAVPLLAIFGILGRRHPGAGGLAGIAQRAFGDQGYVIATLLFLGAVILGLPAIAITGGYYAAAMLGGSAHAYAIGLLLAAVGVNILSAERAGRINAAIASLLVVVLVAIALTSMVLVRPGFGDLLPATGQMPPLPIMGTAFMMVFFAFTGWEVSANLSGEFKNPARDFPLAIGLSFIIAVVLYGMLALVAGSADLTGIHEAPFAGIFGQSFGRPGVIVISLVSVLLVFANLSAAVWAVSRMVYSAAGEGLLPRSLARVRGDIPARAVIVTVAVLVLVTLASWAGVMALERLLAFAGQNFLLLYAAAALALVRLSEKRAYKALGWASVLLVVVLSVPRGVGPLVYPLGLIAIGLIIARARRVLKPADMR